MEEEYFTHLSSTGYSSAISYASWSPPRKKLHKYLAFVNKLFCLLEENGNGIGDLGHWTLGRVRDGRVVLPWQQDYQK